MPPRDIAFGERQRLLSPNNMDQEGPSQTEEDEQINQQPQQTHSPTGFWEAVQQRRETSDHQHNSITATPQPRRNKWIALGFGQIVAFIAASVNVTSFTLENRLGVVAPNFQLFLMYIFLTLHLFFRPPQPSQESSERNCDDSEEQGIDVLEPPPRIHEYRLPLFGCLRLRIPWYLYLIMSSVDVFAGVIMLLSLQYTSLTSVTLLSSLTIPSTMLFSKLFLDKSFYAHHFLGVLMCAAGGILTLWSDFEHRGHPGTAGDGGDTDVALSSGSFQINIGDAMAVLAALLYGLGDAVSEYNIKHIDRMEFLGMLGLFGMILTGLQFPFQELDTLFELFGDPAGNINAFLLMGGYVTLLLLYYVTEASFLVASDATLLNLSLQSQNLWAIIFSVLTYQTTPPRLFYLAVVFVGVGVFAYELGGPSSDGVVVQPLSDSPVSEVEASDMDTAGRSGAGRKQCTTQYSAVDQIEIV